MFSAFFLKPILLPYLQYLVLWLQGPSSSGSSPAFLPPYISSSNCTNNISLLKEPYFFLTQSLLIYSPCCLACLSFSCLTDRVQWFFKIQLKHCLLFESSVCSGPRSSSPTRYSLSVSCSFILLCSLVCCNYVCLSLPGLKSQCIFVLLLIEYLLLSLHSWLSLQI